jgi:hypothetical protein
MCLAHAIQRDSESEQKSNTSSDLNIIFPHGLNASNPSDAPEF